MSNLQPLTDSFSEHALPTSQARATLLKDASEVNAVSWPWVQALGAWDDAVKLAEKSDRINLKATHYRFAQHHEAVGNYAGAIKHYQLSDTHRHLSDSLPTASVMHLQTYTSTHALTHSLARWSGPKHICSMLDLVLSGHLLQDKISTTGNAMQASLCMLSQSLTLVACVLAQRVWPFASSKGCPVKLMAVCCIRGNG